LKIVSNIQVLSSTEIDSLRSQEIDILVGDSNNFQSKIELLKKDISPLEKKRAQKFIHDVDSQTFISTHYFLRQQLAETIKVPLEEVNIQAGSMKKPKLENTDLDFNISHSKNHFAIMISDSSNLKLGIDIEIIKNQSYVDSITQEYMHKDEADYINNSDTSIAKKNERFLEIWTRKEAFLKMIGIGLENDLSSINMAPGKREISVDVPEDFDSKGNDAFLYTIKSKDYIMSCSLSEKRRPLLRSLQYE